MILYQQIALKVCELKYKLNSDETSTAMSSLAKIEIRFS